MIRLLLLTLLAVLLGMTSSSAQEGGLPLRPPIEVGIGLDKIATFSYYGEVGLEGFEAPSVSFRGTVPVTARYAIEGIVSFQRRDERFPAGYAWVNEMTEVMYAIQVKRGRRQRHQPVHVFTTFGAAGAVYCRVRQERTVGPPGREQVIPRSVDQTVFPPVAALPRCWLAARFPAPHGVPRRCANRNALVPSGCGPGVGDPHDSVRPGVLSEKRGRRRRLLTGCRRRLHSGVN